MKGLLRPARFPTLVLCYTVWASAGGSLDAQQRLGTWKAPQGRVTALVFAPDSNMLISGGTDGCVAYWDWATQTRRAVTTDHGGGVRSLAFSPNGRLLAVGSGDPGASTTEFQLWPIKIRTQTVPPHGEVSLWSLADRTRKGGFSTQQAMPTAIAFANDGSDLITASFTGELCVNDLESYRVVRTVRAEKKVDYTPAIAAKSGSVCWGGEDGGLALMHLISGDRWSARHSINVLSCAFSPNEETVASGAGTVVSLRRTRSGEKLHELRGHASGVGSLAFSPDGGFLASGGATVKDDLVSGGEIRLWRMADARQITVLHCHGAFVNCLAFSPDGKFLASASDDGTIALWRVDALKP
jgi:WD40 repeat protein